MDLTGNVNLTAREFEEHRLRLWSVAYRMLGSRSEAEDAVQETWLRLQGADNAQIRNLAAWLTTVVGRVSIDLLRRRQARHEDYVGAELPEPLISLDDEPGPEQQTLLADAVGVAMLVVLDTLEPPERLAFVLHDMFAVPFEDIAVILERSPAAARQLASRARRRVRDGGPAPDADLHQQRRVAVAFLRAARAGDFAGLLDLLAPDVVIRTDTGGVARPGAAGYLVGAAAVARQAATAGPGFARICDPALVNGGVGLVVHTPDQVIGIAALTVVEGRITAIDLQLDPAKLPS